jgi:hypothetical protein
MPTTGAPIACQNCGLRWNDGDFGGMRLFGFVNTDVVLHNNATNCPRCGGSATVMNGTYEVREGRWQLVRRLADDLRAVQATPEDYVCLLNLLRVAQKAGQATDQVADEIEAQTPFARLAATVRAHPVAITAWLISVLLTLLPYFIAPKGQPTTVNIDVNVNVPAQQMSPTQMDELARKIAQQVGEYGDLQKAVVRTGPQHVKGSERNQPCRCGSGIKAKKCCADPAKSGT